MPGLDRRPQRRRYLNHEANRGTVKQHPSASHDPRNCAHCAPLRHPSGAKTRRQLAVIGRPRPAQDGQVGK